MNHVHTVLTVARTEAKLFARSWLFRFMTLFTVLFTGFLGIVLFLNNSLWMIRSLPPSFPYFLSLMLAIFESLLVIFGAIESVQRDRKLNSVACLHIHNFSNLEYITGKALGVLFPCVILNVVMISAAMIGDLFVMDDVPFVLTGYIVYPLLILAPSLVFMTGLSFLVASIFRSIPLTLLLLVGFYAQTFFNRYGLVAHLIDFNAMHLPLMSSTIIGFSNPGDILLQRSIFFFSGIGSVLAAGLVMKRLPQSTSGRRLSAITAISCAVIATFSGSLFAGGVMQGNRLREHMTALNREYVTRPRARLAACDLDIVHHGSSLDIEASLTLKNTRDEAMNSVILSLNPGFTVRSVTDGGTELDYTRDTQIIEVALPSSLGPGDEMTLKVTYDGAIDDDACYPDIAASTHNALTRVFTYVIDRKFGFITNDYVLLTPECQWYPSSGIPYGLVFPDANERDFTAFTATIETADGLTVVSQGTVEQTGGGVFVIHPETNLPSLTLVVGHYVKKTLDVDGVEVAVYHQPGSNYFISDDAIDVERISDEMARVKAPYELNWGMTYPFKRFSLIETPVQFQAFERPWVTHLETVQPQMALIPEQGYYISALDRDNFDRTTYYEVMERQGLSSDTIDAMLVNSIRWVAEILMRDEDQLDRSREMRARTHSLVNTEFFRNPMGQHYVPGYTYSAQFYPFITSFESGRYPIFNAVLDFYRKHGLNIDNQYMTRFDKPLLDEEVACLKLADDSFAHYLENGADFDTLNLLLMLESNYLFSTIQAVIGHDGFDTFLNEYIAAHRFGTTTYEEFAEAVNGRFGIDMDAIFESWYNGQGLPMFEMSDVSLTEIVDGNYTVYQTTLTLTNTSPVRGTVWVGVRTSEDGYQMSRDARFIILDGHQSKQIGIVSDNKPPDMLVNYLVSQNLPIMFTKKFGAPREDHAAEPFEGERIVPYSPNIPKPGTIVVDNLDDGFEILSNPEEEIDPGFNRRYNMGQVPGDFIVPLHTIPPEWWGKAVFSFAYGRTSVAHFTRGGKGDAKVIWRADIPEPGKYDLEYYMIDKAAADTQQYYLYLGGKSSFLADYNLTISHAGADQSMVFMPDETQPGWQYVTTFDLEPGQVDVILSNKSDGVLIYADAIRWVKK